MNCADGSEDVPGTSSPARLFATVKLFTSIRNALLNDTRTQAVLIALFQDPPTNLGP
jgi:hypothetical protein